MTTPLRVVFLDVGGPLYPDDNFVVAALVGINELRTQEGLEPINRGELTEVFDYVRNSEGTSMRKTFAEKFLGSKDRATELHEAIAPHWVHPEGTLYPDVLPFLESVRGLIHIGIVANQEVATKDALLRDGLGPYVESFGLSALVGLEKPSPEFFQWALDQFDAKPPEALHVGNRFDTDVAPASALGLRTAWVLRGEAPDDPPQSQRNVADFVVSNLTELKHQLLPELTSK